MKFLLTLGLLLAISFAACSSEVEEGSGFTPTDTTNVVKKTDSLPVKVFKPDDTASESGSGDDDEDSNSKKPSEEGSGASGEGELPTSIVRITTVDAATTGRPETSTKFIMKQTTEAVSTVHPTEDEESAATTKYFEDVVTTERTTTVMDNNIPDGEPPNDGTDNDVGGTFGSQRKGKNLPSKKDKKKGRLSFTVGIITGVVIGAILAILIILFLVYRLRKKDEGSYALGDPATGYYKDDPGSPVSNKEYFA